MSSPSATESWTRQNLNEEQEAQALARSGGRSRARRTASNLILHLHPPRVPVNALRFTYTWGLGGISALLAIVLGITGVMLMFRYEPSIERAYVSIQILESQVAFGSLFRAVHHWSANLVVISTFLHLLRVFLTGSYKRGRAANWFIGTLLFILVLAFNFTGYLLPWDQLAYWAITVSTSLVSYVPVVGPEIGRLLLADAQVGQGALSNFYAAHVAVLPVVTVGFLAYHFWKVRKDGGISQPEEAGDRPPRRVPTIPHLVEREFAVGALVLAGLVLFAMVVPAPLGELANPQHSPNPAKSAWYFSGLQELLLHMHPLAAIVLVVVVLGGLAFLPRLDRSDEAFAIYFRSAVGRRAGVVGAMLALYLVPLLVVLDEFVLDIGGWLSGWPLLISTGLIPLALTLGGLGALYGLLRRMLKASHSEAVVGLFALLAVGLVLLTIVGVYFRGPNMALVLPF
jgi:quinol-cytochrome oxidoreductase complex cytochrome b subunit